MCVYCDLLQYSIVDIPDDIKHLIGCEFGCPGGQDTDDFELRRMRWVTYGVYKSNLVDGNYMEIVEGVFKIDPHIKSKKRVVHFSTKYEMEDNEDYIKYISVKDLMKIINQEYICHYDIYLLDVAFVESQRKESIESQQKYYNKMRELEILYKRRADIAEILLSLNKPANNKFYKMLKHGM